MYSLFNTPGPNFSDDQAISIVNNLYDLNISIIKPLSSDRDQNFLLYQDDKPVYVLKISHPDEMFNVLEMQHRAINHIYLMDDTIQLPKEVKSIDGDYISVYKYHDIKYYIRIVKYIPGNLMKDLSHHDNSFINMLGTFLGRFSSALKGFEYENSIRIFPWDISQTNFLYENIHNIDSNDKQMIIEHILNEYENKIKVIKHDLPMAIIHNDANDHNIIINKDNLPYGIIDFGDIIKTFRVCEPAICIAYLLLDRDDSIQIIAEFLNAYQSIYPLTKLEINVIIYFICLRLCVSVTMAAYRKKIFPDNKYIRVTENQAWDFLIKIQQVDLQLWSDQIMKKVIR